MKNQFQSPTSPTSAPQKKHIRHDLSWEEKREIAYEIFDRISHGEMLRDICSEQGMPHPNTLRNWAYQDTPLQCFYACAQKLRLDGLLEELMELTNIPAPMCKDARGNERVDTAAVNLMKHRFEAKKWIFTILQRDSNWSDRAQRDPGLTHYPAARPLSVPPTPEPPVSSGQPEGAAPEGAGKNSEVAAEAACSDSKRETRNSKLSVPPPPMHKKSASASDATNNAFVSGAPNPKREPEDEPRTSEQSAPPPSVHKKSKPDASNVQPPAQNAHAVVTPSAPPPHPLHETFQRQLAAASHTLRYRRR